MATLVRCDICSTEYDPPTSSTAYRAESSKMWSHYGEQDRWDICSPRCLAALAARRDPTLHDPTTRTTSDADALHEDLRWVLTSLEYLVDPDLDDDKVTSLVQASISRVSRAMDRLEVSALPD